VLDLNFKPKDVEYSPHSLWVFLCVYWEF